MLFSLKNKQIFIVVLAIIAGFVCGAVCTPKKGWKAALTGWLQKPQKEAVFVIKEHKPFVIIVPSYNNSEWAEKNLGSIFTQKYDNYRVIYIDDDSNDGTLKKVNALVELWKVGHRIEVIHNDVNKGACENIYNAVHACRDDEIAVIVDGDDWLAHDRVLARLNEVYANPEIWLTYGSYIEYPSYSYSVANFARALPKDVIEKGSVREYTREHFCLSHLRSFYAALYKKIPKQDLLFEGKFYDAAQDLAFMIPMVEMAGGHVKYLNEIFYIYNRATPLNDNKVRGKRQQQIAEHVFSLPKYSRVKDLSEEIK